MSGNARTLTFSSGELGNSVDLLLMFEAPEVGTLYKDLFPVCWKVLKFNGTGGNDVTVEYTADSGLLVPKQGTGNTVVASNWQHCQTGQNCVMETNDEGNNFLNPPVAGVKDVIMCEFKTALPSDVGFGFINKTGKKIEAVMKWQDIGVGSLLKVQLTPKLKIYAVTDYQETQIVRAEIESALLFEENLIALPNHSEWVVSFDVATQVIKITRA